MLTKEKMEISKLAVMQRTLSTIWKTIKFDNESSFHYSLYIGYDEGKNLAC